MASGRRFKGKPEACIQQLLAASWPLKKPDIARQTGRMSEEHSQRHFMPRASCRFSLGKARKQLRQRLIEGERPILMQKHSRGSGRDHLGDARQVEDSRCRNRHRWLFVGESPHAIECQHLALRKDAKGRPRKSLLQNRLLKNRVGRGELNPLSGSGRWQ
ncbi:MAG: hypothetical protein QOJ42_3993 [Acidobacteriaceae bacterium]|nr:hypothetical protein [Acidobacteriaceae bacterium]